MKNLRTKFNCTIKNTLFFLILLFYSCKSIKKNISLDSNWKVLNRNVIQEEGKYIYTFTMGDYQCSKGRVYKAWCLKNSVQLIIDGRGGEKRISYIFKNDTLNDESVGIFKKDYLIVANDSICLPRRIKLIKK